MKNVRLKQLLTAVRHFVAFEFIKQLMNSLLVSPASLAELRLLTALLKQMNITAKILTDDEKEDLGLGLLMRQATGASQVRRQVVMQKLGRG